MKNNTERTKKLIEEAIRLLPEDFALRDARYHMFRAINEIDKVENRRCKRGSQMTPRQKWEFDLQSSQMMAPPLNPQQRDNVIANIDKMIGEQEQKIREIQNKDQEPDMDILTD